MLSKRKAKHLYLKLATKVRSFLLKALSGESLIFLFFVVIATGFWLLQTLDNDYEMVVDVPVHLRGVPDDVVITEEPVAKLRVKVKDKGSALLNYIISRRMRSIPIDFAEHKDVGGEVQIPTVIFERDMQSRLNISTKIVEILPDTLSYLFCDGECRRLPVVATGRIKTARQYYLSNVILEPDSVLAYAPHNILDTLTAARTEAVDHRDLSETISEEVGFSYVRGVKFVPEKVKLTCHVDVYTEKTVEVPVVGDGFPAGMVPRSFPATVKVTFMVGLDRFSDIHISDFAAHIHYDEYLNNSDDKLDVTLDSWPDFISNVRVSPEKVDFLIERN
jgi:hypothetical protein